MTQYFSKFPLMYYDINGSGNLVTVRDIIHKDKFLEVVRNNTLILYPYIVKDGETPEIIAAKLYGSSQYHWIVLFSNNIFNLWADWPLSYDQFMDFLTKKYGDVNTPKITIDHYEDVFGNVIDLDTYNLTVSDGSVRVYQYDFEVAINEAKKNIVLLDAQYVSRVESELDKLLAS